MEGLAILIMLPAYSTQIAFQVIITLIMIVYMEWHLSLANFSNNNNNHSMFLMWIYNLTMIQAKS